MSPNLLVVSLGVLVVAVVIGRFAEGDRQQAPAATPAVSESQSVQK
jgi:hypothetical protein